MCKIVRALLVAALPVWLTAQALPLRAEGQTPTPSENGPALGGQGKDDPLERYRSLVTENALSEKQHRLSQKIEQDERNWKRLTSSICAGCGLPSHSSGQGRVTPGDVLAKSSMPSRNQVSEARTVAQAEASRPTLVASVLRPKVRYVKLRRQLLRQTRLADAAIRRRAHTAQSRAWRRKHYARAHLRTIRRMARALPSLPAARLRITAKANFVSLRGSRAMERGRNTPVRTSTRQRYALCTYSYDLFQLLAHGQPSCGYGR
ncbi:hypothetical protein AEGHOMDF_4594 [Methylobacterium soli]|nr:hypothetical protein [Methylobacterium soli]GJE45400.1 hypothetical protein AEGHOMDF_4594 [Methylobacterium soli]